MDGIPLAFVFAMTTAVLWGFTPILSKRGMAGGASSLQGALVVVTVDSVLYWLAILWRQGLDLSANLTVETVAVFAVGGLVGTALGRLAVFTGVDRVGATINTAGQNTRPVFAMLLAVLFLGERVTLVTVAGIVVLVVGLITLSLAEGGDLGGWRPRDLVFPLAAALFFGVGNVVRKFALGAYPVTLLEAVAINETAATLGLLTFALVAGRRDIVHAPRRSYGYFVLSGVLSSVALLSLFAAFSVGRVVVVDPLAATSPLFTLVFAWLFLGDLERVTLRVVAGAGLIVTGIAMITAL